MAYKTSLKFQCEHYGCTARAGWEVRAYGNQMHGRYCSKHADQRVKELTQAEANNPAGFR